MRTVLIAPGGNYKTNPLWLYLYILDSVSVTFYMLFFIHRLKCGKIKKAIIEQG